MPGMERNQGTGDKGLGRGFLLWGLTWGVLWTRWEGVAAGDRPRAEKKYTSSRKGGFPLP